MKKLNVLVMGPKGSGKTTICIRLTGSKTQVPNGYVETQGACRLCYCNFLLPYGDCNVDVLELGGYYPPIHTESYIFARLHALIYVLDVSNSNQMEAAKETLQALLNHEFIRGKPCLILGNKGDKLKSRELEKAYNRFDKVIGLRTLKKTTNSKIATSLISARSLKSDLVPSVEWLLKKVHSKYGRLVKRSLLEQAKNFEEEEQLRREEEAKARAKSLGLMAGKPSYTRSKARAEVIRAARKVCLNIWYSEFRIKFILATPSPLPFN
jgi:GTPase SAR1 family protein